jgi:hypothetical protein
VGKPGVDDDCDGTADNAQTECDSGLLLDDAEPMAAARAVGLCSSTDLNATGKEKRWGVVAAAYEKADGSPGMAPLSHGLMPNFGAAKAQQGGSLLVLSSGTARTPSQSGYQSVTDGAQMGTTSGAPPGFPKSSTLCPSVTPGSVHDPAALRVQVRVPTNAQAFMFRLNFYSSEFPLWVCTQFNDVFVTMLNPMPAGLPDGNIAFDSMGNAIGVNTNLLQVCKPQVAGDAGTNYPCPLGTALLAGTGFDTGTNAPHGATGWLQTQAPSAPGSVITVRFAIWDSGDAIMDSTVLLDRFEWLPGPVAPATAPVANPI